MILTKIMISKNEIKLIKSLSTKKNRLKELLFIVEGEKMVEELLSSNYKIKKIYASKEWFENNCSKLDLIDFQKISYDELSNDAKSFIKNIENELNTPVTIIGTGPAINDVVDRRN